MSDGRTRRFGDSPSRPYKESHRVERSSEDQIGGKAMSKRRLIALAGPRFLSVCALLLVASACERETAGVSAQRVISTEPVLVTSVFGADVDGDGDLDVLSALFLPNEIAWYENTDGAGSFGAQQVIPTAGDRSHVVVVADVDGDGDLDVLSAGDDKIAWYENTDGAGSFGAQQVISTAVDNPRSVFGADVDGDGDLDVLSASLMDHKIAWYENTDGAGSFGAQQVISTTTRGARSVFGADVDGDGDLDVLWGGARKTRPSRSPWRPRLSIPISRKYCRSKFPMCRRRQPCRPARFKTTGRSF